MKQKDIRPAPSLIEYKSMRFLITDRPSDVTIQSYLQVCLRIYLIIILAVCEDHRVAGSSFANTSITKFVSFSINKDLVFENLEVVRFNYFVLQRPRKRDVEYRELKSKFFDIATKATIKIHDLPYLINFTLAIYYLQWVVTCKCHINFSYIGRFSCRPRLYQLLFCIFTNSLLLNLNCVIVDLN